MNTTCTTRLDDRFNGLLIAAAVACVLAVNVGTLRDAWLGHDGAEALAVVMNPPAVQEALVALR